MSYQPLPHDSKAPEPSGILPNTYPDSHAVWTIEVDGGSGQRYGDAVMQGSGGSEPQPDPELDPPREATKAIWSELNVYKVNVPVEAFSATWRDGNPPFQTYRSRWQTRPSAEDSWKNSSWTNHGNTQTKFSYTPVAEGQVRFQTQCRDSNWDPVTQVNSFASVKTVEMYTMGEIEVWDSADEDETRIQNGSTEWVEVGKSVTYIADVTGNIPKDKLRYEWKIRNGYAQIRGEANLPYCSITHGHIVNDTSSISCSISCEEGYVNENLGFMWTSRYMEAIS